MGLISVRGDTGWDLTAHQGCSDGGFSSRPSFVVTGVCPSTQASAFPRLACGPLLSTQQANKHKTHKQPAWEIRILNPCERSASEVSEQPRGF